MLRPPWATLKRSASATRLPRHQHHHLSREAGSLCAWHVR